MKVKFRVEAMEGGMAHDRSEDRHRGFCKAMTCMIIEHYGVEPTIAKRRCMHNGADERELHMQVESNPRGHMIALDGQMLQLDRVKSQCMLQTRPFHVVVPDGWTAKLDGMVLVKRVNGDLRFDPPRLSSKQGRE